MLPRAVWELQEPVRSSLMRSHILSDCHQGFYNLLIKPLTWNGRTMTLSTSLQVYIACRASATCKHIWLPIIWTSSGEASAKIPGIERLQHAYTHFSTCCFLHSDSMYYYCGISSKSPWTCLRNNDKQISMSEEVKAARKGLMRVAWLLPRAVVMSWPPCNLALVAPDTTEGREDRAVQSWPRPSLTATLGRIGPAPHQLHHLVEWILLSHLGSTIELTLFVGAWVSWPWGCENGEQVLLPLSAMWWCG